jgi:predicted nucleic acid-binding protein
MTTFLDTNVLIAALNQDDPHHDWAVGQIEVSKSSGPAIVVDIVYCEFSMGMETQDHVDQAVDALGLERLAESDEALFLAGRAFQKYKRDNKGPKLNVLPDFLVGAVVEASGGRLVTANAQDYLGYFPDIQIIAP